MHLIEISFYLTFNNPVWRHREFVVGVMPHSLFYDTFPFHSALIGLVYELNWCHILALGFSDCLSINNFEVKFIGI